MDSKDNCIQLHGKRGKEEKKGPKRHKAGNDSHKTEDSGREGMYIPSAEFELRGWINECRVS